MRGLCGAVLPLPPSRLGGSAGTPAERADPGRVSLVGAGPGDPELITVRGLRRLREADAVVYDRLIPEALLDESPDAARVYCGKEPGRATMPQEEINALLVALARSGRRVVRLKGGDPFVFGRGGEEAAALEAAGVEWEVVPGLTSAVAVPALAGIPVTHRGVASSFTVTSARGAGGTPLSGAQWGPAEAETTVGAESLVLLMGVSRLEAFTAELTDAGRDPDTPAALVERGTLPDERVIVAPLHEIASRAAAAEVASPAVLVVGEVVRLRERLTARSRPGEPCAETPRTTVHAADPERAWAPSAPRTATRRARERTTPTEGAGT